jgi:penicillin-binding protein 2
VLVDNQSSRNIALIREQTRNLDQTLHILAQATTPTKPSFTKRSNAAAATAPYRPIVLIDNATQEQYIAVMARRLELPGIIPQEVPSRKYPGSQVAAHLFGYVGEIREDQLARAEYTGVEPGAVIGQAGIEYAYNKLSSWATDGSRTVVVNSVGREIGKELDPVLAPRRAADSSSHRRRCAASDRRRIRSNGFQRRRCRPRSAQR